MKQLKVINVPDKELREASERNAYNLYQGDLFRGYVVKGIVREPERLLTHYLVFRNPRGWDNEVESDIEL